ncbi:MAG: cob(I)yrinic acid a,c-diamide adenosyltransferase [Parvularculaceae bacterium]
MAGDRLDRIVTRGGDRGETSLGDGARVGKNDPRIALLGDVDELNAWIGVVLSQAPGETVRDTLVGVQHDLFDLGGGLCFPGAPLLSAAHVARLDDATTALNADLPPLKEFVLPGGAPTVAWLHVARTVCRRAERTAAAFLSPSDGGESGHDDANARAYLNRLSDYCFVAARAEARRLGAPETLWRKSHSLAP